jgi:hypothetical protein
MSNTKPHPDMQYDLHCGTCNRTTKQVIIDKGAFYCTVCCTVGTPSLPDTNETMKAMMEMMSEHQKLEKELISGQFKR